MLRKRLPHIAVNFATNFTVQWTPPLTNCWQDRAGQGDKLLCCVHLLFAISATLKTQEAKQSGRKHTRRIPRSKNCGSMETLVGFGKTDTVFLPSDHDRVVSFWRNFIFSLLFSWLVGLFVWFVSLFFWSVWFVCLRQPRCGMQLEPKPQEARVWCMCLAIQILQMALGQALWNVC